MKILLFYALLIVLLIPSIASCSQNELSSKWLQAFAPLQDNFSISERFKQQQAEFDFNGDGLADTIYYTDVVSDISDLSSAGLPLISLVQPWPKIDDQKQGSRTAIVIIHGSSSLVEGSLPVVIHDKNDVSVLDTLAMQKSEVIKKEMIAQLEEAELSNRAKGDVILIPTEAGIDSFIYWDAQAINCMKSLIFPDNKIRLIVYFC